MHKGWILDNLHNSRLDYCYAFLAISSSLNFLLCLVAASFFVYNVNADTKRDLQEQKENSLVKAHQDNENLKVG
jgi:peptide/histidine transporter 3/4